MQDDVKQAILKAEAYIRRFGREAPIEREEVLNALRNSITATPPQPSAPCTAEMRAELESVRECLVEATYGAAYKAKIKDALTTLTRLLEGKEK